MGALIRLPPEWAPQSFVLLAWPHPDGDFAPWLKDVEHTYALITSTISRHQPLLAVCRDEKHERHIKNVLHDYDPLPTHLHFVSLPYHDTWLRDTAPLTVWEEPQSDKPPPASCQPRLVDFRFNGWGGKYPCLIDDALGDRLRQRGLFASTPYSRVDWVLEGGSVETDGQGTLLATRSSILNPNRNPDPDQGEKILRETLGLTRFLWLHHGQLEGDDTDGHIDTLARFCNCDTIIYQSCGNHHDPHYEPLQAMALELTAFRTWKGTPYQLIPLPMPAPLYDEQGQRLPASYANFLLINGAVLVPQYDDPADNEALSGFRQAFPARKILPIPCRCLIHQYGSLHCLAMQYPLPLKFNPASAIAN